jgi:hypothetical protein
VSACFGVRHVQPGRRSEPNAMMWDAVEERERFARDHPEVLIKPRRDGELLLFDVSAPAFEAVEYDDALVMLGDLRSATRPGLARARCRPCSPRSRWRGSRELS